MAKNDKIEEASLTDAIKIILRASNAETKRDISRNLQKLSKKPIVIEYGDEVMVIKDGIKAALRGTTQNRYGVQISRVIETKPKI